MTDRFVTLKKGRERSVTNRHPWIFSGAIARYPTFEDGEILAVQTVDGTHLGWGYFNRKTSIAGRMVSFSKTSGLDTIAHNVRRAVALRQALLPEGVTGYRVINAEGDQIPGLIVDRYGDVLVIQAGTLGIERLKPWLVDLLCAELSPRAIYEKSTLPSRKEEGLSSVQGPLYGEVPDELEILEYGARFAVNLKDSQKTGFFLDQREMRKLIGSLAAGRRVLNCFAYSGGFSVHAARGGAQRVDSVEISKTALDLARRNFELNDLDPGSHGFLEADVFEFLRGESFDYDLVVLDPPAFTKHRANIAQACHGYRDINRLALERIAPGGLLLTCSCSYFVDEALFQKTIFEAAREARRFVRILQRHRLAFDHPLTVFHPESDYLKSFLLQVE